MSMTAYTMAQKIAQREFNERLSGRWQEFCAAKRYNEFEAYEEVLDRGSADFCVSYDKGGWQFTEDEKALLYCKQYMGMHYDSSAEALRQVGLDHNEPVLMFDVGCGPGTSGLALHDLHASHPQWNTKFHYVGIDRAPAMLRKAQEFVAHCRPAHSHWLQKFEDLPKVTAPSKFRGTVLVNFSFLLMPRTFREAEKGVKAIVSVLKWVLKKHRKSRVFMLYQNPVGQRGDSDDFHRHWRAIKHQVTNLVSLRGFPSPILYDTNRKVYCDILTMRQL